MTFVYVVVFHKGYMFGNLSTDIEGVFKTREGAVAAIERLIQEEAGIRTYKNFGMRWESEHGGCEYQIYTEELQE